MANLVQRAFREDGYAVDVQASGDDAVWMASECDFDAVILDIGLPDMDGFDVCRQLRGRARWMPIVMLTAREAVPDRVRGLHADADDYVTKPRRYPQHWRYPANWSGPLRVITPRAMHGCG